ncbi:MAG: hypothetical protein K1X71_03865 [Pirellulales bacterium]|nr:hypothetical protein [Pirellulales bacterium]
MVTPLLASHVADLWYALPLIVSISLVYAGTRLEHMEDILPRAARMAWWTIFFLSLLFVLLYLVARWL